jgi:hypothetical protein
VKDVVYATLAQTRRQFNTIGVVAEVLRDFVRPNLFDNHLAASSFWEVDVLGRHVYEIAFNER